MSDILCVTNRNLCKEKFLSRIEEISKNKPKGIILREKDLSHADYTVLASQVIDICKKYDTPCILHSNIQVAIDLKIDRIHLPMQILQNISNSEKKHFFSIGASCHSVKDAIDAENLGCTYITAGHIFNTDCKKGLRGRGLDFLQNICESVSIPVYAIGGINKQNYFSVRKAGASGVCIMSGLMCCDNVKKYMEEIENDFQ